MERNTDTPESKAFWDSVAKMAEAAEQLPAWKRVDMEFKVRDATTGEVIDTIDVSDCEVDKLDEFWQDYFDVKGEPGFYVDQPPQIECDYLEVCSLTAQAIDANAEWARETFGPGERVQGVLAHIRKELLEIEAEPHDLSEWVDVILLALDGASRQGYTGAEIIEAWHAKVEKNHARNWPDWRTQDPNGPIEHVK